MGTLRAIAIWMLLSAVLWAQPVIENAPISFTTSGSNVFTMDVAKPSGLADGELLIAFLVGDGGGEDHSISGSWTAVHEDQSPGADVTASLWCKDVSDASSEPANYTFTQEGVAQQFLAAVILRISGAVDCASLVSSANDSTAGASDTASGTAVTATEDDSLALGFTGSNFGGAGPTLETAGWNDEASGSDGAADGVGYGGASKTAASGSTGNVEWSFPSSRQWVAFQVALAPASGDGYTVISHLRRWMPPVLRRHQN